MARRVVNAWVRGNSPPGRASRARHLCIERLESRALLSLTHLYTFNDGTARDWAGDAHGSLENGASVVAGRLTLANSGLKSGHAASVQHARLPAGVLPAGAATVEVWYAAQNSANWERVFDFGSQTNGSGDSYLFFTAQSGAGDSRAALRPSGSTERVVTTSATDDGSQHVAAVVIDASAGLLRLYVDGTARGTAPLSGATAGSVTDTLAYLGRSLFTADPGFTGSIDELRIYDEALSAAEIAAHAAGGPVAMPRAGDYDNNGASAGGDFLAWQRNDGTQLGLDLWQGNYGWIRGGGPLIALHNDAATFATLDDATVTMTGQSELHVTGGGAPLLDNTIHLNSEDAWVFLENVKPSDVIANHLVQMRVNGAPAVAGVNVRVVQYELGTVVIPHAPALQPLQVFAGPNFTGATRTFGQYAYYDTAAELGQFDQNISSFQLKRGYMATIATSPNGAGSSKVYVAQDHDMEVSILPAEFDNAVRYVYVVPWRWVSKKGTSDFAPEPLDAAWHYNWNNSLNSPVDWEYVPIRQQRWWPGYPFNKPDSTHLLGFNEPNNPVEDAYETLGDGSVDAAIAVWPELMATGLRLGSPAVTDGGKAWLYEFMDKAIAANLRVDYIAIHNYQQRSNTNPAGAAADLYNWLKDVYDRYHLPIWITEFNNGANWTGGADPTYEQNAAVIGSFINMMDETPWIERYSIYGNVEDVRDVNYADGTLTPMGLVYHDNASPIGYLQEPTNSNNNQGRSITRLPLDGDALDASGYGHNAQVAGVADFAPGQRGQAIQLDGTTNYLRLPEGAVAGNEFTFASWVNWDGGGAWQRIFDFGNNTNQYMFLTPSHGGNMRFAVKNGGSEQIVQTSPLPVGQWTHVAVTLGGGQARLYVNGSLAATSNGVTIKPSDFDPQTNYLGKSQFADPLFAGRLDDIVITDTVLTQSQIAGLMINAAPQFSSQTVTLAPASQTTPYSDTVAGLATDADAGDTITYSKAHGPAWLTVAPDGALSGIPTAAPSEGHEAVIAATDYRGASSYVVVNIPASEMYWTGDLNNWWSLIGRNENTNWSTTQAGTPDPGMLPTAATDVVFAASNAANLPGTVLGADMSVASVRVAHSTGVTIGGSHNLTLGAGGLVTQSGAGATTINTSGQVILAAPQTWTIAAPVTISSTIAGSNGLTKAGAATLTLSGDNQYTGVTTVAAGTLALGGSERIADSSTLAMAGGTLSTAGFDETLGALSLANNSTIDFGAGASDLTFSGAGAFTPDATLVLANWTDGVDRLYVGTTATLTPTQLGQIKFGTTAAKQLATGEVVPDVVTARIVPNITAASFSALLADRHAESEAPEAAGDPQWLLVEGNFLDATLAAESTTGEYAASADEIWSTRGTEAAVDDVSEDVSLAALPDDGLLEDVFADYLQ